MTAKLKPNKRASNPQHVDFLKEQVRLLKGAGWKAHAKDFERAITALRVIHTWATFDGGRCLDPQNVADLTRKALTGYLRGNPKH